ncbi:MAG: hypothetical protein ACRCWJ_03420 [Casimicrobium sp.]
MNEYAVIGGERVALTAIPGDPLQRKSLAVSGGAGGGGSSASYALNPIANSQKTITLASGVAKTLADGTAIPANAVSARVSLTFGDLDMVRYTLDGSAPAASRGYLLSNSLDASGFLPLDFANAAGLGLVRFLLTEDPGNNGAAIEVVFFERVTII